MSTSPTAHYYPGPDKVYVYWDYENIPIPRGSELRTVIGVLKERIWDKLGPKQVPIQFKLYIRATKLNPQLSEEMDINGVEHINISSRKPESVDKRMLIDIALQLYELEKYKKSNAIALISGDKDFGHLLSRIHKEPPISHSLLILLNKDHNVNPNLSNNVDFVINDFTPETFKICRNKNCQNQYNNCPFYHPKNNYYPMYNNNTNNTNNKQGKKHRKKKKRHNKHMEYGNTHDYKRRKIDFNVNSNNNNNNNNVINTGICESDSSIEIIENLGNFKKITIKVQQIGTDRIDMIKINKNDKINVIINELKKKYNNIEVKALRLQFNEKELINNNCDLNAYNICDGDNLIWFVKENCNETSNLNDEKGNEIECKSNALNNKCQLTENPYLNINANDDETESENDKKIVTMNSNENDKDNQSKPPSLDLIRRVENVNEIKPNVNDDVIDLT